MRRKVFFAILIFFSVSLTLKVISPYLGTIVFAFISALIFKPVYNFLLKIFHNSKSIASFLTIVLIVLIILGPISFLINITVRQTILVYKELSDSVQSDAFSLGLVIEKINNLISKFPFPIKLLNEAEVLSFFQKSVQPALNLVLSKALNIGGSISSMIPNIFIYLLTVSAVLTNFEEIIKLIKKLSPLENVVDDLYIQRISAISKSMVGGTFVIAFVQTLITILVYYICGVRYIFFLAILVFFLSIIPVGSGIISFPLGIAFILTGSPIKGILIFLTHLIVVTNIDNFLRTKLIPKEAGIHPVLSLIGILGGIKVFGFMGLIYGPVILIFLITTIEIYLKHFNSGKK